MSKNTNHSHRKSKPSNYKKYKGIHFNSSTREYTASINYKGTQFTLGSSSDPVEAAKMYDTAVVALYNSYNNLNFAMHEPVRSVEEKIHFIRSEY